MTDGASQRVTEPDGGAPLLEVSELAVVYDLGRHRPPLRAVDGVSMAIAAHETVGLVGESGSGKTTIGRAVLGLAPIAEGSVRFAGRDITHASYKERRKLADDLQVVFQDPYGSLNPTRTVRQTLAESLPKGSDAYSAKAQVDERVRFMLERVGLPADAASRYPAHFSGGQRQRIAIARALMARPQLVICDEPTSALDLSVQAQVLNLLRELQQELGLGYLFVSHDLAVVRHVAHRIVVLYRGRVMEQGDAKQVYGNPVHPYTRALVAAAPIPDPDAQRERRVARRPRAADFAAIPQESCPFAPRCPHAIDTCRTTRPALELTPESSLVACHRWRELRGREPVGVDAGAAPGQP